MLNSGSTSTTFRSLDGGCTDVQYPVPGTVHLTQPLAKIRWYKYSVTNRESMGSGKAIRMSYELQV